MKREAWDDPPNEGGPTGCILFPLSLSLLLWSLIALAACSLTSCNAVKKGLQNYAGPSISFSAGYNGVELKTTLYGRTPPANEELPDVPNLLPKLNAVLPEGTRINTDK